MTDTFQLLEAEFARETCVHTADEHRSARKMRRSKAYEKQVTARASNAAQSLHARQQNSCSRRKQPITLASKA